MPSSFTEVNTVAELLSAASDDSVRSIGIKGDLVNTPTIRLQPGSTLRGIGTRPTITFTAGSDGVGLSSDNQVDNLRLVCDLDRCAIFNDTSVPSLGNLEMSGLALVGCFRVLARDAVRAGFIQATGIVIEAADARGWEDRPKGYGVEVIPGAFTLWNQQSDPEVTIGADLTGISAGIGGQPVRGSGVFLSGGGDEGGRLVVRRLETGQVYSDGGIKPGTADRISGGVFTVYGTYVDLVRNTGPVTTYGPNDMVLDNWGTIDRWTAEDKITSFGPSGIGFVNFGSIQNLTARAAIETFGQGARAFNVYDGTVNVADFDRLVTHGDGAVGIQISRPVGDIAVHRGVETYGGTGDSLVKGKIVKLSAIPLSVKPGGSARKIEISGGLIAHGEGISPIELEGLVETLIVRSSG